MTIHLTRSNPVTEERFLNRTEAGRSLAGALLERGEGFDFILALARGGIPVAVSVARALSLPLFPMVVRKIGLPGHRELALGALSEGGSLFWNQELIERHGIRESELSILREKARKEVNDRVARLRSGRPLPPMEGKNILIVDDGVATGATLFAAVLEVRRHNPNRVMVALPVAPPEIVRQFRKEGISSLILIVPHHFQAVGEWYEEFSEVSDGEVLLAMNQLSRDNAPDWPPPGQA